MTKKCQDKKKQKTRKDLGKKDSKAKKINEKAQKTKKKTTTVYLPAILVKPKEEEPMSEHQISYLDSLLAIEMEKLAAKGLNNEEIIKELGISKDTFYRKLKEEPYFSYSLYKHRGIANHNVENALYKRAVGYTFLEKTTEAKPVISVDDKGNVLRSYALIDSKIVQKEVPGDVKAQEMYLTNRNPDQWKKKVEPSKTSVAGDMSKITFSIKRRSE